ncbi:glycine cleavage system aminomethyltransferase GcvT [Rhodobacteraceae bacterium NNCM2]|nr:glycine cleavage system aminomethyltransferase GcvT [Coraliihabitans acroporae]
MSELKQTPLHDLHVKLGAKMVPFAGYDMPVQYKLGVLKEHLATRESAGLFDVSHMGQVTVRAKSGEVADAALAMERLVPVDVLGLAPGRQRYAVFTNEAGGILDDLMITNAGDHLFVVVNAACKEQDIAHMRANLTECEVEELDRGLLALQGPTAEAVLATLDPKAAEMAFMDVRELTLLGTPCAVSRSGYSGEDGYEISVPSDKAAELAEALLADERVEAIGLGARDSLRLEAGLCLYGHDIDTETSPVEASLAWAIQKVRRRGGEREGGFPGAERILGELADGAARRRVGLSPDGRAPMREGTELFADTETTTPCGIVTSGGFGPSVGAPVSMGYLPAGLSAPGTTVYGDVRGKRMPVTTAKMPFITPTYKR